MKKRKRSNPAFTSWHVGVAAEAIAAAQFARCGVDVSVQYGADQPEYDLIVASGELMLKVSVKGSVTGSWGLTQSHLTAGDYHGAIDLWLARHQPKTVFCFVQFKGAEFGEMPRLYLAHPEEVAERLKATAGGGGYTKLFEKKVWTDRARGAGTTDEIPSAWEFTPARLQALFERHG